MIAQTRRPMCPLLPSNKCDRDPIAEKPSQLVAWFLSFPETQRSFTLVKTLDPCAPNVAGPGKKNEMFILKPEEKHDRFVLKLQDSPFMENVLIFLLSNATWLGQTETRLVAGTCWHCQLHVVSVGPIHQATNCKITLPIIFDGWKKKKRSVLTSLNTQVPRSYHLNAQQNPRKKSMGEVDEPGYGQSPTNSQILITSTDGMANHGRFTPVILQLYWSSEIAGISGIWGSTWINEQPGSNSWVPNPMSCLEILRNYAKQEMLESWRLFHRQVASQSHGHWSSYKRHQETSLRIPQSGSTGLGWPSHCSSVQQTSTFSPPILDRIA